MEVGGDPGHPGRVSGRAPQLTHPGSSRSERRGLEDRRDTEPMAGQGAGGQGWWWHQYLEGHPQMGEALQRKALGAGESDGSRGPTGALSTPEEGGYLFRWSRRKRKVSRLASGSDSSRLSMQLSFATGSESAAGGGGGYFSQ